MSSRPQYHDQAISREACRKLAPSVIVWLQDEKVPTEEIVNDLARAAQYYEDGYEIAKGLDHIGWSPNSELVEILDAYTIFHHDAHKAAIAAWVQANDIKADLPIGTRVAVNRSKPGLGTITGIREATAEYLVAMDGSDPTSRSIIPYEDVAALAEATS